MSVGLARLCPCLRGTGPAAGSEPGGWTSAAHRAQRGPRHCRLGRGRGARGEGQRHPGATGGWRGNGAPSASRSTRRGSPKALGPPSSPATFQKPAGTFQPRSPRATWGPGGRQQLTGRLACGPGDVAWPAALPSRLLATPRAGRGRAVTRDRPCAPLGLPIRQALRTGHRSQEHHPHICEPRAHSAYIPWGERERWPPASGPEHRRARTVPRPCQERASAPTLRTPQPRVGARRGASVQQAAWAPVTIGRP